MSLQVETRYLRLGVNERSEVTLFLDRFRGTNHAQNAPLAAVEIGDEWIASTSLEQRGGEYYVRFGESGAEAKLSVAEKPEYLIIQVESLEGAEVTALRYLSIPLEIEADLDAPFVAGLMALDVYTKIGPHPMPVKKLEASCYPHLGVEGTSLALVACPPGKMRGIMKQVVFDAPEVPKSRLGGPFALDAPETRGSYMMDTTGSIGVDTVDQWIHMARSIGMDQLDWHCGKSLRYGDLHPHPENFPEGFKSVKETIDKLHAAGMTAGLHTYAFFLAKDSKWVTPVPDKRLLRKATFTLAEDIDAEVTEIPVVESTTGTSTITGFFVRNSTTLHIDDELIVFEEVVSEDGNAFVKCTRGAHGTKAAPHKKGAPAHHLQECFGLFVPDANTTLFDEVIQTTADVFNACGFDMIYLDAIDGSDIFNGWDDAWHYGGRFVWELHKRLERPSIMEMSMFTHHMWYVRSRAGAWDRPTRGAKHMLDMHIIGNRHYDNMFMPKHLGWWGVNIWSGFFAERMFTDDLEYLSGKCIAYDSSQSQLTGFDIKTFDEDTNAQRMGAIVRQYEALRLNNRVPDSIRRKLAVLGDEFTLKMEGETPTFQRVHYDKHKVHRLEPWAAQWNATNPYEEQPLKIRIETLLALEPYDHPDSVVVAEFKEPGEFAEAESREGVTLQIRPVDAPVKVGEASGALIAETQHTPRDDTWAARVKTFDPLLDLNNRALGVWVHGDGSGHVINLQIQHPDHVSHALQDHYITVDFEGWRYIELVEYESYDIPNYNWPYCPRRSDWESSSWIMRYAYPTFFYPMSRNKIETIHLYVNNLPAGKEVTTYLSPIKSIPVRHVTLKNPSVTINGQTLTFPVDLPTASYLEMYSGEECKVYDYQGLLVTTAKPQGTVPTLRPGENEVTFTCEGPDDVHGRANVTVISYGEVLRP